MNNIQLINEGFDRKFTKARRLMEAHEAFKQYLDMLGKKNLLLKNNGGMGIQNAAHVVKSWANSNGTTVVSLDGLKAEDLGEIWLKDALRGAKGRFIWVSAYSRIPEELRKKYLYPFLQKGRIIATGDINKLNRDERNAFMVFDVSTMRGSKGQKWMESYGRRGLKESDDIEVLYRKNGEWVPEEDLEEDMSPEDAEDNKILQGIYAKMQKKVNTKLTPEEQFIMDKYGLSYPYGYSSSSKNPKFKNKSPVVKYPNGGTLPLVDIEDSDNVDKINLPDKVRKMRSRAMNRASLDRNTKDAQYRYFDVKSHLNNIKNSKQRLKDMDTDNTVDALRSSSNYQGPATRDNLGADIGFYRDRRASDRDFLHNSIKDNQDYINRLLRRDESYKKRLKELSHGTRRLSEKALKYPSKVKRGWLDTVIDGNGNEVYFDTAVELMDDDIREQLCAEITPCSKQEFFDAYCEKHFEKYGEEFQV